jgi:hypothetical protein
LGICNAHPNHAALDRIVIVARPRFRLLAGKDGDVASAVAVEIFNPPGALEFKIRRQG